MRCPICDTELALGLVEIVAPEPDEARREAWALAEDEALLREAQRGEDEP